MRLLDVDHTAFVVADLDKVIRFYAFFDVHPFIAEEMDGMRMIFFSIGNSKVEYIQPLSEKTPVSNFLRREGGGLHHIAYSVGNLDIFLDKCRDMGIELLKTDMLRGLEGRRVAFFHPMGTFGTLIELVEKDG